MSGHGLDLSPCRRITTVAEMRAFLAELEARGIILHPDDSADRCVNHADGSATFTPAECEIYDRLMSECFEVCDAHGLDIYVESLDALHNGPRGEIFLRSHSRDLI